MQDLLYSLGRVPPKKAHISEVQKHIASAMGNDAVLLRYIRDVSQKRPRHWTWATGCLITLAE